MDDPIFGISAQALALSERRASILTDNIVNSSTPHYKARDIDFHNMLRGNDSSTSLEKDDARHMSINNESGKEGTLYRVPMQNSLDGNTVDENIERKNFIENALNYQVNLKFVEYQSDQLMSAIKGD